MANSKLPWDLQQLVEAIINAAINSKQWRVAMVLYERKKDADGRYEMVPAFSYGPKQKDMPTMMMFPALEFLRIAQVLRAIGVEQADGEGVEIHEVKDDVSPPRRN